MHWILLNFQTDIRYDLTNPSELKLGQLLFKVANCLICLWHDSRDFKHQRCIDAYWLICLKEQCTQMAASMPFCAQYRIGLSAEPSSARIKLPTAWNLLSCDEKFSDKTSWWVTYFCNSSYRVTYNSYSVQTELMILMPTITKTNQIASTITKSDSKNQSNGPKNAVLDSKLDPFTKQHRVK